MNIRWAVVVLVVSLLGVGVAHATYLTPIQEYGETWGSQKTTTYADGSLTPLGAPIYGFDTSLGTLRGVTVWVYGMDATGFFTSTNETGEAAWIHGAGPRTVTCTYNSTFTGTAPGVNAVGNLGDDINDVQTISNLTPNNSYTWPVAGTPTWTLAQTNGLTHVDPSYFPQYTGASTLVPVNFTAGGGYSLTDYYKVTNTYDIGEAVLVRVQYEYDLAENTPEPCTLTLLGLGVCGIGWRARRRKRAAQA